MVEPPRDRPEEQQPSDANDDTELDFSSFDDLENFLDHDWSFLSTSDPQQLPQQDTSTDPWTVAGNIPESQRAVGQRAPPLPATDSVDQVTATPTRRFVPLAPANPAQSTPFRRHDERSVMQSLSRRSHLPVSPSLFTNNQQHVVGPSLSLQTPNNPSRLPFDLITPKGMHKQHTLNLVQAQREQEATHPYQQAAMFAQKQAQINTNLSFDALSPVNNNNINHNGVHAPPAANTLNTTHMRPQIVNISGQPGYVHAPYTPRPRDVHPRETPTPMFQGFHSRPANVQQQLLFSQQNDFNLRQPYAGGRPVLGVRRPANCQQSAYPIVDRRGRVQQQLQHLPNPQRAATRPDPTALQWTGASDAVSLQSAFAQTQPTAFPTAKQSPLQSFRRARIPSGTVQRPQGQIPAGSTPLREVTSAIISTKKRPLDHSEESAPKRLQVPDNTTGNRSQPPQVFPAASPSINTSSFPSKQCNTELRDKALPEHTDSGVIHHDARTQNRPTQQPLLRHPLRPSHAKTSSRVLSTRPLSDEHVPIAYSPPPPPPPTRKPSPPAPDTQSMLYTLIANATGTSQQIQQQQSDTEIDRFNRQLGEMVEGPMTRDENMRAHIAGLKEYCQLNGSAGVSNPDLETAAPVKQLLLQRRKWTEKEFGVLGPFVETRQVRGSAVGFVGRWTR